MTATTADFLEVLESDRKFAGVRFNTLRGIPEQKTKRGRCPWTDVEDAGARAYIEENYGFFNRQKYEDAFRILQGERRFDPLQELIREISWDGFKHCEGFLTEWMGAEDCPYTREVSRLLFAGGIARAFNPGCKFDCVPVLIGSQGAGKSTLCQWLAMEEEFFSSVKVIKGQRGVEAISGKWICELEELLATGGREVEEVKAYISTNSDFYRKPYDRRPQDNPRHCIFIGTTNRSTFLTDLSGNRRWFPVEVHSNARDLYKHESEIKYDIEQCWAEMLHAYETGEALARPVENYGLIDTIRGEQERAQVDDHRVGLIGEYLQGKNKVCLFQIWRDCLHRNDYTVPRMERRDSVELASIVTNKLRWRRGGTEIFPEVGRQKAFYPPEN